MLERLNRKDIPTESRIIQVEEMKLKLFEKNGEDDRHFQFQKWFLENSKLYSVVNEKLSKKVSENVNAEIKNCYYNCWKALNLSHSFDYCEGYAISNDLPIPIEHSWLLDSSGRVVDPTLIISGLKLQKQLKKYHQDSRPDRPSRLGSEYYGIKYKRQQVNEFALKTKKAGCFLYHLFIQEARVF